MNARRQKQVAGSIHKELSYLLQRRVRDERLALVTVTGVDMTADLQIATVYVTVLDNEDAEEAMAGLNSAAGYLRREVGQSLPLRYVPKLIFEYDHSIEHGQRIESLLADIAAQRESDEDES